MTVVWRVLGATPPSLLILQVVLYWTGLGLLASELQQRGRGRWAFLILATGLTPISLFYIGTVQDDTLLTALLLMTIGLSVRFGTVTGAISGVFAVLTRPNAVFAAPPLLLRTRSIFMTVGLCGLISLALIPASRFVNIYVFRAERSHVEKSLQLFDLAGIEHFSGRHTLGPQFSRCYTPFYWDTLALDCQAFAKTGDELTGTWLNAIAAEPLAYAEHRLSHFNDAIFFLVPPIQECVFVPQHHPCAGSHLLLKDAVTRNALFWPITWLLIGLLLLVGPVEPPAQMLALSGLLYGFGYLAVGVASGFRYFYWTELAVQLAIAWQVATSGIPQWRRIMGPTLILWAVAYAYRYLPLVV